MPGTPVNIMVFHGFFLDERAIHGQPFQKKVQAPPVESRRPSSQSQVSVATYLPMHPSHSDARGGVRKRSSFFVQDKELCIYFLNDQLCPSPSGRLRGQVLCRHLENPCINSLDNLGHLGIPWGLGYLCWWKWMWFRHPKFQGLPVKAVVAHSFQTNAFQKWVCNVANIKYK